MNMLNSGPARVYVGDVFLGETTGMFTFAGSITGTLCWPCCFAPEPEPYGTGRRSVGRDWRAFYRGLADLDAPVWCR